jgi:4-oxalocrotonate tautomerase
MPFVRITVLGPPLAAEQIGRLHADTTELMMSVMRKSRHGIAVLVDQPDHAAWSIGGTRVALAAHVEVVIGVGTNTADEKARFMAAMMASLRGVLGPELREETYIVFHEIDTGNYGRGGLTRAERDRRQQAGGI